MPQVAGHQQEPQLALALLALHLCILRRAAAAAAVVVLVILAPHLLGQ